MCFFGCLECELYVKVVLVVLCGSMRAVVVLLNF